MEQEKPLTVGELAKKMNTTVRTLQYYDREGILKPSMHSEGGRRLYTSRDVVKLHQILSLKYLGFSLDEIKSRLILLETPYEVACILQEQAEKIRTKIEEFTTILSSIELMREEVIRMNTVDFNKYAEIISLLQQKNENFWALKCFDETLSEHINKRFTDQTGNLFYNNWMSTVDELIAIKAANEPPEGAVAQALTARWWGLIMDFTGGDMSLLRELERFNENRENWDKDFKEKHEQIEVYIGKALEIYLKNSGGLENEKDI